MDQVIPPVNDEQASAPALTQPMIDSVTGMGPWVRFFSILAFLGIALMVLMAIVILVGGVLSGSLSEQPGPSLLTAALGLVYLVLAGVYVLPAIYLFRCANGAASARRGDVVGGVETALTQLRSFWRFIGIVTIVILCLYPIFFVLAITRLFANGIPH